MTGDGEQVADQGFLRDAEIVDRGDVLVGHDQYMGGGDGVDVQEGRRLFVGIDDLAWPFPEDDLAEDAVSWHVPDLYGTLMNADSADYFLLDTDDF